VCAAPVFLFAQTRGGTGDQRRDSLKSDLPSMRVSFSEPKLDSPLDLPSVVVAGPAVCSSNGLAFAQFLTPPPRYNEKHIYSISSDGKVVHYAVEQIVGLTNVSVVFNDPGVTGVVVLFRARKVGEAIHSNLFFMAFYHYDGELRGYTQLDLGFEPVQVAQLTDDRFLVAGSDHTQGRPRFVAIDGRGTIVKELIDAPLMPGELQIKEMFGSMNILGMSPNELSDSQRTTMVLSTFHPVHSERSLLILEPGPEARVIEISRAGESRIVKLKLPANQLPYDLLIAKARWFVRTMVQGSDTQMSLLEVDPNSGQALRWISTSDVPAGSIACPTDSGFSAIRWIDHKPYLLDGRFER